MGRQDIAAGDEERRRQFARALLDDLRALEQLCRAGRIERDVRRVGAEQEMFLIRPDGRPAPISMDVLPALGEHYTTELACFNMEYNVPAVPFESGCLDTLRTRLDGAVNRARAAARGQGGDVLLVGILPTLERSDLSLDNLTPLPRYHELNRVMTELSGGTFRTAILGTDDLQITHDSVMLEACNTSFQVHFQVSADEFPSLYNLAQVVTAPVLAAAANSPVLLHHRLWHETRIAVFEQSLDFRSTQQRLRGAPRRVSFGTRWVEDSVVELFREDIARYRILLAADLDEVSTETLDDGGTPALRALCLHNGTVYRWNRPCYGVKDGVAHLRIENRALPAGPTVVDEVANAAFYFGLLAGLGDEFEDVRTRFQFDHVKANFLAAARYGLNATFKWADGWDVSARSLILDLLLPMARAGLARNGIPDDEIGRYLGVLEERVRSGQTGSQWAFDALGTFEGVRPRSRFGALTRAMAERQLAGDPVHTWAAPAPAREEDWRAQYQRVGQVMTTDLFTVHPEDLVDVAASVMQWEHLRHVPVEDDEGNLVGLVSHRSLLKLIAEGWGSRDPKPVAVRDIMKPDPVTASPDMACLDAIDLMRRHKVGCLPVVQDGHLVGIVSERDFILITARLLEQALGGDGRRSE